MTGPKREYPQFKFDSFNLENGLAPKEHGLNVPYAVG